MRKGVSDSISGVMSARPNMLMGRYDIDGIPIRHEGPLPPIREEENEHAFVESSNWHYGMFNMGDPEHRQHGLTLVDVMNACANGLFLLVERERMTHKSDDGTVKLTMYVEWVEKYRELDQRFKRNFSSPSKSNEKSPNVIH